jgi:S-adenosylmethionine hydrolase
VAAALANGLGTSELGPTVTIAKLRYEPPTYGEVVRGTIVAVDRFGNAITDIEAARLRGRPELRVRDVVIDRVETAYGNAAPGPFLIVGSSGCVEISLANASAAERLQLRRLERVELWQSEDEFSGS